MVLETLQQRLLVNSVQFAASFSEWQLIPLGIEKVSLTFTVHSPCATLKPRDDVPVVDLNIFELMYYMAQAGWEMRVLANKKRQRVGGEVPEGMAERPSHIERYVPGADKVWWSKASDIRVLREYLVALALADEYTYHVEHFQSIHYYTSLMSGTHFCGSEARARVRW